MNCCLMISFYAFCLSSFYEGLPISLLEAFSCGCTPICTAVGGIVDVIKNGENGYLSLDLSVKSYVDAIMNYIESPIERKNLIQYYRNNYTMEKCANKYEAIYNSL